MAPIISILNQHKHKIIMKIIMSACDCYFCSHNHSTNKTTTSVRQHMKTRFNFIKCRRRKKYFTNFQCIFFSDDFHCSRKSIMSGKKIGIKFQWICFQQTSKWAREWIVKRMRKRDKREWENYVGDFIGRTHNSRLHIFLMKLQLSNY